jgi:hypothetical protein
MRCPSCSKFATYDTSTEPEVEVEVTIEKNEDEKPESDDVPATEVSEPASEDAEPKAPTGEATVSGTVRIVLTAECCGDELKECTFDVDQTFDVKRHSDCTCGDDWAEDPEVEGSGELTERQESSKSKTYKTGPKKGTTVQIPIPFRYQKRFYGACVELTINCGCGKEIGAGTFEDEIQASSMDELT